MTKKKKLIWQIFPSFLIITLLSISVVASYSTRSFKTFFLQNSEKELTSRARLLQEYFTDKFEPVRPDVPSGISLISEYKHIDDHCKTIGEKTGTRVTIILPSGVVIGDSDGEVALMENHMKRPEIINALKNQTGVAIRYSATLDSNMMYIALPVLKDGTVVAVVRTAVSTATIDKEINHVRNNILAAMFFTILIAAVVSLFVSRRIASPIELMKTGALKFSTGNLTNRLAVPDTEELSELAVTMNRMASNLDDKIRDFKNRSMELEAVHSSMQEGVIAIDENERIITINEAAAKIFDFPSVDLKGRVILEVARNLEFQMFIQKALSTHEPVEEDIVIPKDQDLVLRIHSSALYDHTEKRMGTLIIFHDITHMRRLETMHKDFASNVSHELKTPLTTIKGFIETLQEMLAKKETEQSADFLKIIEKNVNRMISLINDLLSLSRLERLKGTQIHFEDQDLSALIAGVVNACKITMVANNISVDVNCPEYIRVKADPILLEQAVFNLVDNAVKYSHSTDPVVIQAIEEDKWIHISVKDSGCGIDKEHLPKIFNRFYRVDKARSRHDGGTGLGLAIVKHIVRYHNGKIAVESTRDKGTCFTISLPV